MTEQCFSVCIILAMVAIYVFFKMCEAMETYGRIVRQDQHERFLRRMEEASKPRIINGDDV